MKNVIRVLVAARSAAGRAALSSIVASDPALEPAGPASDTRRLRDEIEERHPDVVLLLHEGRDGAPEWSRDAEDAPVVLLNDEPRSRWIRSAFGRSVRAVLPADAAPDTVVAAIEAAAAGLVSADPDTLREILAAPRTPAHEDADGDAGSAGRRALTPREIEVLGMIADGLPNKTIAWRLKISEHTVKFHVTSIFAKLGAASRTEAVTEGLRRGLILL